MKRLIFCILCLSLLLCACARTPTPSDGGTADTAAPTELSIPQGLAGVWVSAHAGEWNMIETITFGEDGSLSVQLTYEGSDYQTIYGTYTVSGGTIFCDITEGTTPFQIEYTYRIDGRELYLTDEDGEAQYLRNS